jgi:protoporphyrinogen/coproporphyrinogen III oxidase
VGYTGKVVIIGGGISGLACAFRLKQLGIPSLVLEGADRPGGVITTICRNGSLFETGPQCPRFPAPAWKLVHDLQLENEFLRGDPKAKRYILRNGTLHEAPFSPDGLIATRLLGFRSKMRIFAEGFRSSHAPSHEESLAEFVQRKFGMEVLDNLVDPFISTVFFGDSYKMGMQSAFPALVEWERQHGSLLRGAIRARESGRKSKVTADSLSPARPNANGNALHVTNALPSLGSFKTGMGRLPEKIAEELLGEIEYKSSIVSVAPLHSGNDLGNAGWQVGLASGEKIDAKQLILAVPAYVAGELLASVIPPLAIQLKAIEYASISVVSSVYDRSKVSNSMNGFGFMVPRREGLQTICTFWNSSLFPNRVPEGKVLMTSFAGGAKRCGDETNGGKDAMPVEVENAKVLGISGPPIDQVVWKDCRALPQYNVGHVQRIEEIGRLLHAAQGLHLVGNYLKGRSIGDCVEIAFRVAKDVHSRIYGDAI